MSDPTSSENKKKRASRRYPYPRAALCEFAGQTIQVQLLNISTSGIQFASRSKIDSKEAVVVRWKDAKYGEFTPSFLLAREIHQPDSKEFSYYYGAQYCSLSDQTKQNLLQLLKSFKEEESKEVFQQVQKITPQYLLDVMSQPMFVQDAMAGKALPYFSGMLGEIKDYEKAAFNVASLSSKALQRLTVHNFHCALIKVLVPIIAENVEFIQPLFEKTLKELSDIRDTEDLVEGELKKIIESKMEETERKNIQQHLNESSNRLYYSKQDALQLIVTTFEPMVQTSEQLSGLFMGIQAEYQKMVTSNAAFEEQIQVYSRKSKKPEEFSKVEAIADIPVFEEKKYSGLVIFGVFFLIVAAGIFAYIKIDHFRTKGSLTDQIGLTTPILNYGRMGTQIDLELDDSWSRLDHAAQLEEFKKIVAFLKKDRQANSAIVFDNHHDVIQVLYEDREPQL